MIGLGTKESNVNNGSSSIEIKKKKRQRTRIRKRNKNYHLLVNGSVATVTEVTLPESPTTHPIAQQQVVELIEQILQPPQTNALQKPENSSTFQLTNENRQDMKPVAAQKLLTAENAIGSAKDAVPGKTRDQVLAEREAKKLAKQVKKSKSGGETETALLNNSTVATTVTPSAPQLTAAPAKVNESLATIPVAGAGEKSREQIKADREAKKLAKQAAKVDKNIIVPTAAVVGAVTQQLASVVIVESLADGKSAEVTQEEKKKPALSKAERRNIQEAQRAAKAQKSAPQKVTTRGSESAKILPTGRKDKTPTVSPQSASATSTSTPTKTTSTTTTKLTSNDCKVKLFNHLKSARKDVSLFVNNPQIHPSMARLGEQYAQRTIVGSNARCIAFLNALKMVIQDFETPLKKEFSRSLETSIKNCVEHLQKCRPLAVSVTNAYKHIKHVLTQLPTDEPESELKENLCHFIDTYIENQIGKAAQAISSSMQEKIRNGDVILTFGCSSLINYICEEAHGRHIDFRVIVVDSRPFCEGQELLRRLTAKEIPCTYVLINALGFVMPEATKVLLGAHALLSNGYVMARTGTAQVALVARAFNVPVLVCCETHKFSESFQTDAIVYNELGNPDDLIRNEKCCLTNWQAKNNFSPLNLIYDITPPELVTAVVTEVSILPCTSVPVILRIKPTEIGYYS